ncbi:CPCC family cysteine-rich protein [Streptomyces sp. NPDC048332]|uniref:CPCC family cysteine-rich protein n=1 Tax=Streptomyces sp. NPDC048332 TaxID=3154619 RepID=UPI0034384281
MTDVCCKSAAPTCRSRPGTSSSAYTSRPVLAPKAPPQTQCSVRRCTVSPRSDTGAASSARPLWAVRGCSAAAINDQDLAVLVAAVTSPRVCGNSLDLRIRCFPCHKRARSGGDSRATAAAGGGHSQQTPKSAFRRSGAKSPYHAPKEVVVAYQLGQAGGVIPFVNPHGVPEAGAVTCPCCFHRTLSHRGGWEMCRVCDWEDDGQDDHNADVVIGGPNYSRSLTEARSRFRARQSCDDRCSSYEGTQLTSMLDINDRARARMRTSLSSRTGA